jgi:3-hydroxybutyryl-CoA dehydratase
LSKKNDFDAIPDDAIYCAKIPITDELLKKFGDLAGDYNPLHVNDTYAKNRGFKGRVAYGNILGLLVSQLIGMHLWSQNVMLVSQKINFKKPVFPGDVIELTGKIVLKSAAVNIIELSLLFSNDAGEIVASGKCQVRSFS